MGDNNESTELEYQIQKMPHQEITKKYTFELKNVNLYEIDKKYQICMLSNIQQPPQTRGRAQSHYKQVTLVADVVQDTMHPYFSFMDENKKNRKWTFSMSDYRNGSILASLTHVRCFWDQHQFKTVAIGCPIRWNKSHNSYDVDGVFCSFNCAMAFACSQKDVLYEESVQLLYNMYFQTYDTFPEKIHCAPSWRLLQEYGGHLMIEEFRRNMMKVEYVETNNVMRLAQHPIGFMFEETTRF